MNEIRCPHCGQVFTVDESEYAAILSQVRGKEFDRELSERLHAMEASYKSETRNQVLEAENKVRKESVKDREKLERDLLAQKELVAKLQSERDNADQQVKSALALQKMQLEKEKNDAIQELQKKSDEEKKLLEEEVEKYRDFKAKSSTKMIGESLEQHCYDEFNKWRPVAFPHDYFEKDNEISESGSKGDFIYRAYDENGNELVSIMFEMKNEMDTTDVRQKHKNADFFKELDKDRNEKTCEYAVLCSLLEADSELYNQGIVDVSYRYPKMFVIRPQFLIVIISLLRNAAMNQVSLKKELAAARQSNIDIVNFEGQLREFKDRFGKNVDLAHRKFDETLNEIDKAIAHLQKTKAALQSCDRNLMLADKKADDLTVKKLMKNSPSLQEEYKTQQQK